MASPDPYDERDWNDLFRLAASRRMEAWLIREAVRETRDRSILACTRSQLLLEKLADQTALSITSAPARSGGAP